LPEGKTGYEGMAVEEPERELELSEDELANVSSLSKRTELAPNLSDMQTAMLMLIPEGEWNRLVKYYKLLVVSRISPDIFMPLLRVLVKSAVKRANPRIPIEVGEMVTAVYAILSKGLDGKGIIDLLEISGAAREAEELKAMGGGSSF
jgi:hypothetical protein